MNEFNYRRYRSTVSSVRAAATGVCVFANLLTGEVIHAQDHCNHVSQNGDTGLLCINYDPQGYQAEYWYNQGTYGDWMDFNLVCDNGHTYGDRGAFKTEGAEATYSYVFAVGSQGRCHVVLYDRSSGGETASGSVTR